MTLTPACCSPGPENNWQRIRRMGAETAGARAWQVCSGVCVARSHRRSVVSPLPLARRRPSGLNPTANTASVWPAARCAGQHRHTHNGIGNQCI